MVLVGAPPLWPSITGMEILISWAPLVKVYDRDKKAMTKERYEVLAGLAHEVEASVSKVIILQ